MPRMHYSPLQDPSDAVPVERRCHPLGSPAHVARMQHSPPHVARMRHSPAHVARMHHSSAHVACMQHGPAHVARMRHSPLRRSASLKDGGAQRAAPGGPHLRRVVLRHLLDELPVVRLAPGLRPGRGPQHGPGAFAQARAHADVARVRGCPPEQHQGGPQRGPQPLRRAGGQPGAQWAHHGPLCTS